MSQTKLQDSTYEIQSHTVSEMKNLLIEMKGRSEDKKWQEKAEELAKELKGLKKKKNYGLFWKEKPEEFEMKTKDSFPILEELDDLTITQDETPANIIIEGDNYHTLSVLSYTHKGLVDVIYIDPPYNTGNKDFIYNDRYVDREDDFRHSKWLSFMEKRLKLAKDLLKETGVIFISIDDNEQAQLRLLCDEIFGEENFLVNLIWKKKQGGGNDSKNFVTEHEYVLVYTKNNLMINISLDKNYELSDDLYPFKDEKGEYGLITLDKTSIRFSQSLVFEISDKEGNVYLPRNVNGKQSCWRWGRKKVENEYEDLVFKKGKVYTKYRRPIGVVSRSLLMDSRFGRTETGKELLKNIFNSEKFSYPKPMEFIKHFLNIASYPDSLILDFFAGSGTTGHAVLALNKEDGGNRRFILCSNRENTSEFPDRNICRDITYERVKRVASGYVNTKGEQVEGLGGNIRYLRTDFIPKHKGTDNIRNRMVERCSEMLCLRENIWETTEDLNTPEMRFYKRGDKYLAILFGLFRFEEFCEILRTFDIPIAIYVFSRGQMTRDDFEGITVPYTVEEIPDPILAVYKKIFGL